MKKLILLSLLFASVAGMAQTKTESKFSYFKVCDTCTTSTAISLSNAHGFSGSTLSPYPLSYAFTGGVNGKEMLRVVIPQNKIPFDSLIIYVKKSQIKWLNDSTAVISRP